MSAGIFSSISNWDRQKMGICNNFTRHGRELVHNSPLAYRAASLRLPFGTGRLLYIGCRGCFYVLS